MTRPQSVWLDTDIGDDTDDLLALALICASPELRLAGVSTVFGETDQRVRLAQTLLATVGGSAARVPVHAGCGRELSCSMNTWQSEPAFWPNGPIRRAPIAQLACARCASALPPPAPAHGVDALAAHLRKNPGKTIPVAIGALTNLATLLLRYPAIKRTIPRLVLMAGEFKTEKWEWNIRCDPVAAACVFASGIPIEVIPWEIGMTCTVSQAQLDRLFAGRTRTGHLLARAVRLWRKARYTPGHAARPHLFDPMAVAVLLHPEWFKWRRGRVTVSFAPETFAHTVFTPDPKGPHCVAWDVKRGPAVKSVWDRIRSL